MPNWVTNKIKTSSAVIAAIVNDKDVIGAYGEYIEIEDSDEKVYLWKLLKPHSKCRSAIKAHGESLKEKAA